MPLLPAEVTVDLALDEPSSEAHLRERVARQLRVEPHDLPPLVLRKRSVDARRGSVHFHLVLGVGEEPARDLGAPHPSAVSDPEKILVIGDGPAGLFCAYELARHGIGCTVIDRGKPVQPRRRDLKGLNLRGEVDTDSNYCFGEGGAGTYSDGKLYTRSHKRGSVRDVLEILTRHGAPPAILTEARPHIGSNRLPDVVSSLRDELERAGVVFRFGARVADLLLEPGALGRRIRGVRLADDTELAADRVVLATGHSASDVYRLLFERGVPLEQKPFAVGVRIEHPQRLVNRIQYGRAAGHRALPAAYYRLSATVQDRGVFSFCMCPGGWIVPASTEPDGLVVNGMSLSKRDSPYANSGLVVAVTPEDAESAGFRGPCAGLELQRVLERAAYRAGGGELRAPATRATDFVRGRGSSTVPEASYVPGLCAGDIADVLGAVSLDLTSRLRRAVALFDKKMRGFLTEDAVLVAVESRTSSPVRIVRHPETLESAGVAGLYPSGEGAGYAGGIMSAAVDGMNVARAMARAPPG